MSALAALYEERREAWVALARRHRAGDEAEDVVHDAMRALLERSIEPGEDVDQAVRALVKLFAWRTSRRRWLNEQGRRAYVATVPGYESPPVHDMRVAVQRAVDALDGVGPALVWQAWAQGTSARALAHEWEVSPSVVEGRLRSARAQLALTLSEYSEGRRRPVRHHPPVKGLPPSNGHVLAWLREGAS